MHAQGWPIGSRTRADRYCPLTAKSRRVWWTRDRRPHHPPFPTRRRERAPHSTDLLQAMLVHMQTATFLQSLTIPFAFLVYNHCDAVLDLLESTRVGGEGRLGLDMILNTWTENRDLSGLLADAD